MPAGEIWRRCFDELRLGEQGPFPASLGEEAKSNGYNTS